MFLRQTISNRIIAVLAYVFLLATASSTDASIIVVIPGYRVDVGDANDVEKFLREKIRELGDDPYTLHDLGTVLYRQGQVDAARRLWDQASQKDNELASADVEIIFQQISQGRIEAAQIALRRAMQQTPTNPHVFLAQAQLAIHQRDAAAATTAYQNALTVSPRSFTVNLEFGRFMEMTGDVAKAQTHYKTATEIRPKNGIGWVLLALSEFRRDQIDACLKYLSKAEEVQPKELRSEARLAEMYFSAGDYVSACQWYKKALARDPGELLVRVRLGQMLTILKRNEEARKIFQAVLSGNEFVPALIALAQLEQSEGNASESVEYYRRILKQNPDNIIANNNLAMLHVELDLPAEDALKLVGKAMKLEPESSVIQSTYGCVLAYAGKYAEAIELLRKAVRAEPTNAWVRYCYGLSLHHEKKVDEAKLQFEACLLLDQDFLKKSEIKLLTKA